MDEVALPDTSSYYENNIYYTTFYFTCTALSLIGIAFIFVASIIVKAYKSKFSQIILFLCFADLIFCIPFPYMFKAGHAACHIIDIVEEYFLVCSFFWSASFAFVLRIVLSSRKLELMDKYFSWFIFVCQGLPLVFCGALVAFKTDYDPKSRTCLHYLPVDDVDYSFLLAVALPFFMTFILCVYCYVSSIKLLRQLYGEVHYKVSGLKSFFAYPIVLLLCWGPATVVMIVQDFTLWDGNEVFNWLRAWAKLQGFFNAIVYGITNRLVSNCKRVCEKDRENDVYEEFSESLRYTHSKIQEHSSEHNSSSVRASK